MGCCTQSESAAWTLIANIFLPPLGVFLLKSCGPEVIMATCLTILGWFPGVIYGVWLWTMAGGLHFSGRPRVKQEKQLGRPVDSAASVDDAHNVCCTSMHANGPPTIPALDEAESGSAFKGSLHEPVDGREMAKTELSIDQKASIVTVEKEISKTPEVIVTEPVEVAVQETARAMTSNPVVPTMSSTAPVSATAKAPIPILIPTPEEQINTRIASTDKVSIEDAELSPLTRPASKATDKVEVAAMIATEDTSSKMTKKKKKSGYTGSAYFGIFSSSKKNRAKPAEVAIVATQSTDAIACATTTTGATTTGAATTIIDGATTTSTHDATTTTTHAPVIAATEVAGVAPVTHVASAPNRDH